MSTVVGALGVTHSPNLVRRLLAAYRAEKPDDLRDAFDEMRTQLAAWRPDALVIIGCDHLNQWFMDNMAPFLIGKPPRVAGPSPHEAARFGLPRYEAPVDQALARHLVAAGFERDIDLAFSDECAIDHSFTMPLTFLRPEQDVPLVPVFVNVMAPPLPPAQRCVTVGRALRSAIDSAPAPGRVVVIGSGHLSLEVGGPRMRDVDELGRWDGQFDEEAMTAFAEGDLDTLLRLGDAGRMLKAGNVTSGFLAFLVLVGAVGGLPASRADCVVRSPFLYWDLGAGR
jgi:protocatechuate 4,5-dioxygenase, beta chain